MPKTNMKNLKGWDQNNQRWQWSVQGERLNVTCEELGLPENEWSQEGSRKAAWIRYNQFVEEVLKKKQAEHPFANQIDVRKHRFQIANDLGLSTNTLQTEIDELTGLTERDEPPVLSTVAAEKVDLFEKLTGKTITDIDPVLLEKFFGDEELWGERKQITNRTEFSKTVGDNVKRFLEGFYDESRKGLRSPDDADNHRRQLKKFVDFMGDLAAVNSITFIKWEAWQRVCKTKVLTMQSGEGRKDYQTSQRFVRWCWKQELLELPRNFDDKIDFKVPDPVVETYPLEDIKKLLSLLNGTTNQLKLHVLLMLNCGMTQKDISDLKKAEIDLKKGVIVRKRSKTKDQKRTPIVTYKLWATTKAELAKHLSKDTILALTTKSGKPWLRKETKADGTLSKTDNIATSWRNLKAKHKDAKYIGALISLKKTSASLLRNSNDYKECFRFFLGHSETNVAEKHYAQLTAEKMAAASDWLAEQYQIK